MIQLRLQCPLRQCLLQLVEQAVRLSDNGGRSNLLLRSPRCNKPLHAAGWRVPEPEGPGTRLVVHGPRCGAAAQPNQAATFPVWPRMVMRLPPPTSSVVLPPSTRAERITAPRSTPAS